MEENAVRLQYRSEIEEAAAALAGLLHGEYGLSPRAVALMLLQGDAETEILVRIREDRAGAEILHKLRELQAELGPVNTEIQTQRAVEARLLAKTAVTRTPSVSTKWREGLGRLMIHPVWGLPVLALVLYVGLYQFVGRFGAGKLVNWLEQDVFGRYFNPWVGSWLVRIPFSPVRDLLGGDYGLLTLALRYAVALILPIVGTFFLAFSVIEDSGYLPRLAYLTDSAFKRIGLSGRAVIPMVLGFGCDTMATMVSRTLETKRERIIATFLLALAIPCSAQLGVIVGLLADRPLILIIWACILAIVFLLVGFLASRVLPGERAGFFMELPPLRWPRPSNVLVKTLSRMQWYFLEIVPLFALASVLIWLGRMAGVFEALIRLLQPIVGWLGLPAQAAQAFLFGFFRRDYGAGGLYDLQHAGLLSGNQLLVAMVTMTLFVPCVAQFSVMVKERGWKTAVGMAGFIFPFAFAVGFLLNQALRLLGVSL